VRKGLLRQQGVIVLILAGCQSLHAGYWPVRTTGQGLTGKQQLAGFIDSLLPVYGNAEQVFFLDGTMTAGLDNNSVTSLGGGLRSQHLWGAKPIILGAYAFADYQQTMHRSNAWLANPGIELLTLKQEARLQAYLPVNGRSRAYGAPLYASTIPQTNLDDSHRSINTLTFARGHQFYDSIVSLADNYGSGAELELGQYIAFREGGWLRAGAYHFNYQNARNVSGVQANLEMFLGTNAALIVQDNYDNQNKNKISLGVRFTFGGLNRQDGKLEHRMLDPIIRHQSRQSYGMATPVRQSFKALTGAQVVADNIWFFSRQGTNPLFISQASCTAENPCLDLTQNTVNGIETLSTNAKFWFSPGQYNLASTGTNGYVVFYDGQSVAGRSQQYIHAAQGNERPLINGALWWFGSGKMNDMQLTNTNQVLPGGLTGTGYDSVTGVGAANNLQLSNVAINTQSNLSLETFGILAFNDVYANQMAIMVKGNGFNTMGIFSFFNNNGVSLSNSVISIDALNTGYGVLSALSSVSLTNSTIRVNSQGTAIGAAGSRDVTVNNSKIYATAVGGDAIGILLGFGSTARFVGQASFISVASTNGFAVTVQGGPVVNESQPPSQCEVNGVPAPC